MTYIAMFLDLRCDWKTGKTKFADSVSFSVESRQQCLEKCVIERRTNVYINGITLLLSSPMECICAMDIIVMDDKHSNDVFCFFEMIGMITQET